MPAIVRINPAADTYHAEQALDALQQAAEGLRTAKERLKLAADHAGAASNLLDLYGDTIDELESEFLFARERLNDELGCLAGRA